MNRNAWVFITTNKNGTDVRASFSSTRHMKPWANGRWPVASVYVGSVTMAKAIVDQVKALGPDPDVTKAVATLQA